MRALTLSVILGLFLTSGCGYKERITTSDQTSYLYFTGNTNSVMISIDGGEKFRVNSGRDHQYKITPGTHDIRVYRGNSVIVDRQVYLSDGVAKEIGVD
jgi:hypothetical protein